MAIGTLGKVVFSVSDTRILTPSGISGTAGSDWATHDVAADKPRSEYVGMKLRTYKFDLELNATLGVRPRTSLMQLQRMAEGKEVYWLTLGCSPVADHPFKVLEVSDSWGAVLSGGELIRCSVSVSLEEYV